MQKSLFKLAPLAMAAMLVFSTAAIGQALPAKGVGVTRIGIVQPKVSMAGADSAQSAEAVQVDGISRAAFLALARRLIG